MLLCGSRGIRRRARPRKANWTTTSTPENRTVSNWFLRCTSARASLSIINDLDDDRGALFTSLLSRTDNFVAAPAAAHIAALARPPGSHIIYVLGSSRYAAAKPAGRYIIYHQPLFFDTIRVYYYITSRRVADSYGHAHLRNFFYRYFPENLTRRYQAWRRKSTVNSGLFATDNGLNEVDSILQNFEHFI